MIHTDDTIETILSHDDHRHIERFGSLEHSLSLFVFVATALPTVVIAVFVRYRPRDQFKALFACLVYLIVAFVFVQWRFHDVVHMQYTVRNWFQNYVRQ
jgi:uncharacterized protein HemY